MLTHDTPVPPSQASRDAAIAPPKAGGEHGRHTTIDVDRFRLFESAAVHLETLPTRVAPVYTSEADYRTILSRHVDRLSSLQQLLQASDRFALLLILQGMDAAGKDGVIAHVMSGINPEGCQVFGFRHPSADELQHDFLWRTTRDLPQRGRIGIFNRSYYEEVLIVRVHPALLLGEGLGEAPAADGAIWLGRYRSINDMERHLEANGTRIVKVFLNVSEEEQRKRFLARIDVPEKNWKLSLADVEERPYWRQYMAAYEDCLAATSTAGSPWYAVPADDKPNARLIISQIIIDALEALDMTYPKSSDERAAELLEVRKRLLV